MDKKYALSILLFFFIIII